MKKKKLNCGECLHFEANNQKNYCPFKMTDTEAEFEECGEGTPITEFERLGRAINNFKMTVGGELIFPILDELNKIIQRFKRA